MSSYIGIINFGATMDFISWAKNKKLPSSLQSRSGWAELFEHYRSDEPHVHQIEPTNCCHYTCSMCPRSSSMTRKVGNMDLSLFQKIIDEVSTYQSASRNKEIELFHFGESLFHPKLAQFIDYMSKYELKSVLSINPAELNAKMITDIINALPYKIIVSIDSLNPDRFIKIRGKKANLNKAIENTLLLLDKHKKLNSKTQIIVRMIEMNINQDETESFKKFWKNKGATVDIREFFPWSKPELQELGKKIQYPPFMPCPFPWQYVVVQWNGDVVACCRDYNGKIKLGNVKDSTLKEIWNGEQYKKFREKMATGKKLDKFCQDCLSIYYTEESMSLRELSVNDR